MIKKSDRKQISPKRAILTSLTVDIVELGVNTLIAIITGSIVMLAEAFQSLTDVIAVLFTYLGLKRSQKSPSKKHPFGYGKALYVWTFLAEIIMFGVVSVGIFYMGLKRFLSPEEIKNIYLALIILPIFIIFNSYSFSVGFRRILHKNKARNFLKMYRKSQKIETKTTLVLDFVGATTASIGLIALAIYRITGDLRFDGIGAMAIGVLLGILTLFLLINTKQLLIGRGASEEKERKIKKLILSVKDVKSVLDLKTMNIGLNKLLVNVEVHVNHRLNTRQIEKLIDRIKEKVLKNMEEVVHIQVEIETPQKNNKKF